MINNKDIINQKIKSRKFDSKDSSLIELWDINDNWEGYVVREKYKQFYEEDNLRYLYLDKLFSIGTEMSYKYDVYITNLGLNGIDLKMNNDYMNPDNLLFKNVIPPKEPILNEHFAALVAKEGNISVSRYDYKMTEDDNEDGVVNPNSSDVIDDEEKKMALFCSILNPDIDIENADEILDLLKKMIERRRGKEIVTILLGALKAGLLVKCPQYADLKKMGFEDIGVKQGFSNIHSAIYNDKTGKYMYNKYSEIDTYCSYFMGIKSKYLK